MSPVPTSTSFAMAYMSDGGHIGVLSWFEGSAGWRSIEKVGAEAAFAPGLDAVKKFLEEAGVAEGSVEQYDPKPGQPVLQG